MFKGRDFRLSGGVYRLFISVLIAAGGMGCSSGPTVKKQAYAELRSERLFEAEYPRVWKALEAALRNHRIVERDPQDVGPLEWSGVRRRTLETDWIFSQSRDKYVEFRVNGFPRKKYLQLKWRYRVATERALGGIQVEVQMDEEIEKLKDDGSSAGYEAVRDFDSSRTSELLERINAQLLALPEL